MFLYLWTKLLSDYYQTLQDLCSFTIFYLMNIKAAWQC